jgi:hypothetical protein
MINWSYIVPVVGVLLGWLLNEFSFSFRVRREDKSAFASALTELLELRHRAFAIRKIQELFRAQLPVPPEAQLALTGAIEALLPNFQDLAKRYNQAVDSVAAIDPMLAFRLRSQDFIPSLLRTLRGLATSDRNAAEVWPEIENEMNNLLNPLFDEFLVELARRHSLRSRFAVRRYLRKLDKSPEELEQFIKKALELMGTTPPVMAG